jgi:hypothetical protein
METKNKIIGGLSFGIGISMVLIWGSFISCEKASTQPLNPSKNLHGSQKVTKSDSDLNVNICSPILTKKLMVDENTMVGTVEIYNDAHHLYVNAVSDPNYGFGEARLYTGKEEELPRRRAGELNYKAFNHVKYAQATHYVNTVRFKILLSDLDPNITMAMMIQMNPDYRNGGVVKNAWALGGVVADDKQPEIFEFQVVKCLLERPEEFLSKPEIREVKN